MSERPNRSLLAKSNARLAAAQMLYKSAMLGEAVNAEKLLRDYQSYVSENREHPGEAGLPGVEADKTHLKKLLDGVTAHAERLEPWIDQSLQGNWKKERMSPLLLAILRLALFELAELGKGKPGIIIKEYVDLTARFFSEEETGFVQAALSKAAKELCA